MSHCVTSSLVNIHIKNLEKYAQDLRTVFVSESEKDYEHV